MQQTSSKRQKHLDQLVDFLSLATTELVWLNQKEETEISRDWSARTLRVKDIEEYYEVKLFAQCNFFTHLH